MRKFLKRLNLNRKTRKIKRNENKNKKTKNIGQQNVGYFFHTQERNPREKSKRETQER
jgi:hypothetical protein